MTWTFVDKPLEALASVAKQAGFRRSISRPA